MGAYAKLSKGTDTGYNLFLYGGYLQTAKNPGDSGGQANAARCGWWGALTTSIYGLRMGAASWPYPLYMDSSWKRLRLFQTLGYD